jgi:hypothetical protein
MFHSLYFAYLDPGTGSLLIQSLIGVIAGIFVFGRRSLTALKFALLRIFGKGKNDDTLKQDASSK